MKFQFVIQILNWYRLQALRIWSTFHIPSFHSSPQTMDSQFFLSFIHHHYLGFGVHCYSKNLNNGLDPGPINSNLNHCQLENINQFWGLKIGILVLFYVKYIFFVFSLFSAYALESIIECYIVHKMTYFQHYLGLFDPDAHAFQNVHLSQCAFYLQSDRRISLLEKWVVNGRRIENAM